MYYRKYRNSTDVDIYIGFPEPLKMLKAANHLQIFTLRFSPVFSLSRLALHYQCALFSTLCLFTESSHQAGHFRPDVCTAQSCSE